MLNYIIVIHNTFPQQKLIKTAESRELIAES